MLGRPDVTPENYQEKIGNDNGKEKKKEEDEDDDGSLALAIRQGMDSTILDSEQLEAQKISRRRMRELAIHEFVTIPLFRNPKPKPGGKTWIDPFSGKEEIDYEKGAESWEEVRYQRYPISKKDWDYVENERLKAARKYKNNAVEQKQSDEKYTVYLAKKFFDMDADEVAISNLVILKEYIASSIYRIAVGVPYSQETSKSSLVASTPIR